MRAYCGHELGNLEAFALQHFDTPTPGEGELLISVEATALGFVDQLVMRGLYQIKPPTPFVPGGEVVGTVEAVGPGVLGFVPGQRIAAWQFGGGLAEMTIVRQDHAVPVPADLEPAAAASLLLDYLTAYYGLFDRGGLKPGQLVLVTGASGGVGAAAVRLASAASVSVIGLASSDEKREMVSRAGASLVIDYRNENWREELKRAHPSGVDMVFDPVGGGLFEPCFRSLAKRGRHLVVGFASRDSIPSLPANLPLLKSGELVGVDARYLWETDPVRVRQVLSIVLRLSTMRLRRSLM
ncbi:NADPH:quinone reductase [Altererythrobacter xiamenensis]|uniref:NADPH:quinone reductase n=1 Tax=Altererythrobacter xiamenensis TaxID=1316679 RepID=A0A1Y6FA58_9SPHN|nr:NADPH:quinone oxidoreductase family protein [Altererythrobacter xiamenensis]SMQ69652.1 NADPH:quinone reductase [Altererythrobacter xiamenensis]